MCGILGVIGYNNAEGQFLKVLSTLKHRGPNDMGVTEELIGSKVLLGHCRLSIIDLSPLGHQPMYNTTNNYCIVYNGEVYNFRELRRELESKGFQFKSKTDTEVVLYAYIAWGEDFVEKLDGIFSLAILDKPQKKLILARDRVGVKPLYYTLSPGFIFSSEVKPILQMLPCKPTLRFDILHEYFALNWIMEPDTIFEGIYKVPSGGLLTYNLQDGSVNIERYWSPEKSIRNNKEMLDWEVLEDKLERSVAAQMVSDVPLGVYLSGGIDSSLLALYAGKPGQEPINSLTVSFNTGDLKTSGMDDDAYYAGELIKSLPFIQGHFVNLGIQGLEEYERLISFIEEPLSDPAIVPAYLLAKAAKEQGITVMLSGMGGDELFGGYPRYRLAYIPKHLGRLASSLFHLSDGFMRKPRLSRDVQRAKGFFSGKFPISYLNLIGYFTEEEISRFVGEESWKLSFKEKLANVYNSCKLEIFQKMQFIDFVGFLASHNLLYVDKASMAASVEVRVPLLSNELLDYTLQLEARELVNGFKLKRPLKILAAKRLPSSIVRRTKTGFMMPISGWFRQQAVLRRLKELMHETGLIRLIGEDSVQSYITLHLDETVDTSMKLFNLYTLACWAKNFGYMF